MTLTRPLRRTVLHLSLLALCAGSAPLALSQTAAAATPRAPMAHLPWTKNATIYEVNLRQYSQAGTINALTDDLPRLKKLGVEILWLMPIHPIGQHNRKGTLGSYYASQNYTAVAPEYGSLDDLRHLVKQAHASGMKVMLDWVANHTAWDNPWVSQHPDWFKKNAKGEIFSVTFTNEEGGIEEWTDVVGLDYTNKDLWKGMTDAMAFWVREADIDGFRCDAAGLVPTPFWDQARAELEKIKPLFMLAEWNQPDLHERAFDMTYDWDFGEVLLQIGAGKAGAEALRNYVTKPPKTYPRDAYRMLFTNNHDVNSWKNTDQGLYGAAYPVLAVLSFTLPGMPLIYNGQEAGLNKKLEFFEKDPIDWKGPTHAGFYSKLIKLRKNNPALWSGQYGGPVQLLNVGNDKVFAFQRQQGSNRVSVYANLSDAAQRYTPPGGKPATLPAWGWDIVAPQ
ncbi:MAG: alpha-amylase family glycosyl hydrolase [Sphingomonadaceae bacterium]